MCLVCVCVLEQMPRSDGHHKGRMDRPIWPLAGYWSPTKPSAIGEKECRVENEEEEEEEVEVSSSSLPSLLSLLSPSHFSLLPKRAQLRATL